MNTEILSMAPSVSLLTMLTGVLSFTLLKLTTLFCLAIYYAVSIPVKSRLFTLPLRMKLANGAVVVFSCLKNRSTILLSFVPVSRSIFVFSVLRLGLNLYCTELYQDTILVILRFRATSTKSKNWIKS